MFMEIVASLLIIITGVATIFTIYGFCIMYYDLVKKSAVIGIACGILAIALFFIINIKENNKVIETNELIQEKVQSQQENVHEPLSGCTTHVAAEI